jgi:hypothetical protein
MGQIALRSIRVIPLVQALPERPAQKTDRNNISGVPSPNYSCVRAIEGRALQSEAMGLCLGAACKLSFWNERLRKHASDDPSTNHGIETVRLCASLFRSHLSIDSVSSFFL